MSRQCTLGVVWIAFIAGAAAWALEPYGDLEPLNLPATPPRDSGAAGDAYDPAATALLMNLCRLSLCTIANYNDRVVLDEQYDRLANNIDVTRIRDDEIAELIKRLMIELNNLRLDEATKQRVVGMYNRKISSSLFEAVRNPPKELLGGASTPVSIACQAILLTAAGTSNRAKAIGNYKKELDAKVWELKSEELRRLAQLRTDFFGTEYTLYKRYNLPDRLNLKEVQLEQYLRVLDDPEPKRRLGRLERLKEDFEAFPPFWFQIGLAAQQAGDNLSAFEYYRRFENAPTRVLREDPDAVMMAMHRIMMLNPRGDRDAIRRDLQTIERNTRYYYRWESVLFAALTYHALGDEANARRLIQTSIDEGYEVPLHREILAVMESESSRKYLESVRGDLLTSSQTIHFNALMRVGRTERLTALRALGRQLTDITLRMEPRSKAAQNAAFAVPGYNVYLLGRSAIKGDVYFDNCIVRLPEAWFAGDKPKVSILFNGKTYRPNDTVRREKEGVVEVEFARLFNMDDVVKDGRTYHCVVRLSSNEGEMEIGFDARQPLETDFLRDPDIPKELPYFEMRSITVGGETYRVENGLIEPERP